MDLQLQGYLSWLRDEKNYSPHTINSYFNDVLGFVEYAQVSFGITVAGDLDIQQIRSWIAFLSHQRMASTSIGRKLSSLNSFFKYLIISGILKDNPANQVLPPKKKRAMVKSPTETEVVTLLDKIKFPEGLNGKRDKLMLELLYGTGIRLSELLNLKVQDVDFIKQTIRVKGKGNKERLIPVNTTLLNELTVFLESKAHSGASVPYLITTDSGKRAYEMLVYRTVKKYLSQVTTLDKRSPHIMRHAFATHLLNKGADLNAIKELLGHSSLAATQVYTHVSIEKLKQSYKQAHPRASKK